MRVPLLFCTQDHAALLRSGSRHGASTRARRGLDWRTESQQRRSRERGAALERPWGGAGGSMREPRPYYYRVQARPTRPSEALPTSSYVFVLFASRRQSFLRAPSESQCASVLTRRKNDLRPPELKN